MISLNKYSFGLLKDTKAHALKLKTVEQKDYSALDLNQIISVDFPDDQYIKEQTEKKQIVLHHTVAGHGGPAVAEWWKSTPERIATAIIIDRAGRIFQLYSTKYWAHHLGTHNANNTALNKASIGIEIDSWGGLVEYKDNWYPAKWDKNLKKYTPNLMLKPIAEVEKYEMSFRGFYGFEKYTYLQIEAVRKLLVFFSEKYGIPLNYNEDMFNLSENALDGVAGVWTHVSYRQDKSDCHPQKELIQMLKSLK
jgi:N-acetyl-anhydromuramyl-L-alanine amidase AmpD